VRLEGLEPPTPWFVATCSNPLSYKRVILVRVTGLEPARHDWRRILSPVRLPIPPYPRGGGSGTRTLDTW
jgi:hypothetical protein